MTRDDARRGCRASETMGKHVLRARSTRARGVTRRGRRREACIRASLDRAAAARAVDGGHIGRGSDGARRVRDARRAVDGVGNDGDEWFRAC